MYRIIILLATCSVGMMITALMFGLQIGDLETPMQTYQKNDIEYKKLKKKIILTDSEEQEKQRIETEHQQLSDQFQLVDIHRIVGIAAVLSVVLVNCIIITYFVGTSRWCKEVAETYSLDTRFIQESASLKRRTWPWALLSMVAMVVIAGLGGAADPLVALSSRTTFVMIHFYVALSCIALVSWSFFAQWNNIHTNHGLIDQVLEEVRKVRQQRGQPIESE